MNTCKYAKTLLALFKGANKCFKYHEQHKSQRGFVVSRKILKYWSFEVWYPKFLVLEIAHIFKR